MSKLFLAFFALALATAALPQTAQSHPHVRIDVKAEIVFDGDGRVLALRQTWIFDELYTVFATEGFDTDQDGQADPDKLTELLALNLSNLRDYDYFTRVEVADERLDLADATGDRIWVERDRLRMTFLLPFVEPIEVASDALRYAVYDPTYYVELLHAPSRDAVTMSGAAEGCTHALQLPNPNLETMSFAASLDRNETAGDGLGIHFAEWVSVRCE